jgi:hypothetical protein
MAGMASFGKSIGQSARQGGANILDKGIDAVANTPQAIKNTGKLMGYGINPSGPLSHGAIGLESNEKANNGRGTTENSTGNWMVAGGSDGKRANWFLATGGENNNQPAKGENLMQSHNISDRVQGMGELYREKRTQGGDYSGLDGRFKAIKSSIGEFHAANKKAAMDNEEGKT